MSKLIPRDERAGRPEINVSIGHSSDDERRGGAKRDTESTLQHAVAPEDALAARASHDVAALYHLVAHRPEFACAFDTAEMIELQGIHIRWLYDAAVRVCE